MAANKRPTKGPERPILKSSHGAPAARSRSAKPGESTADGPSRARSAAGTRTRASAGLDKAVKAPARTTAERSAKSGSAARSKATTQKEASRRSSLEKGASSPMRAERSDDDVKPGKKPKSASAVSVASDASREVAIAVAVAGIEKKASGLEVIDVAGRVDYADFLVLMSGRSDRHVTALAHSIEEALRKKNKRALAVEGLPHANWVLMDFGDVVVHVFQDDARSAYDIDALWMDARRVPVPSSPTDAAN